MELGENLEAKLNIKQTWKVTKRKMGLDPARRTSKMQGLHVKLFHVHNFSQINKKLKKGRRFLRKVSLQEYRKREKPKKKNT